MLVLINSYSPKTIKAKSLLALHEMRLPIPPTIISSPINDVEKITKEIEKWQFSSYYIRLIFSDIHYPHELGKIVNKTQVSNTIKEIIEKSSNDSLTDGDLVLQPLINLSYSGGIMVKSRYTLVEYVQGAPTTLFRKGQIKQRLLYERTNIILKQEYDQIDAIIWHEGAWKKTSVLKDNSLIPVIDELIGLVHKMAGLLFEFGICETKPFIFEFKEIPINSYRNLENGDIGRPFWIFSKTEYGDIEYKRQRLLEWPAFEMVNDLNNDDLIKIEKGAYLAHLPILAARRNINCVFW